MPPCLRLVGINGFRLGEITRNRIQLGGFLWFQTQFSRVLFSSSTQDIGNPLRVESANTKQDLDGLKIVPVR